MARTVSANVAEIPQTPIVETLSGDAGQGNRVANVPVVGRELLLAPGNEYPEGRDYHAEGHGPATDFEQPRW